MLRKKKKKPLKLLTKTKQMLHSNSKSTYFYKQWSSWSNACHNIFANGFRWSSRHCEQNSSGFRLRDGANPTRSSLALKNPCSKNAYGRLGFLKSYVLPVFCSMALLLVLGFAVSPLTSNSEAAYANTASLADASLKLTVGNTNLAKQDAKAGEVSYITTSVNVNAANIDGYKVYVQAAPGNSATLRNGNTEITGVGSNVAAADFGDNKWGYALDSTGASVESLSYTSVPENSATLNPAYTTNAVSEEKNFNLAFAAKFGSDATAGHYSTNVLLSAVASAKDVAIFDEPTGFTGGGTTIYNMQDMTGTICNNAAEGATGRLRDMRDMKVYWVTKINNSCWMTQNLDLDLDENMNLTSADTDVDHAVTLATTQTGTPSFSNSAGAVQSFDPGYYVYSAISATGACNSASLSNCNGFTNVLNGIWESSDNANFSGAIDDTTKTYNAHYLVGNYYSYAAATAGTGPATGNATGSICPKGWRLPVAGNYNGDYYNALNTTTNTTIAMNPYYFVYGGNISDKGVADAGGSVIYWSASTYILLMSGTSGILPASSTLNRSYGTPIRCVARDNRKLTDLTYMQDMNMGVCLNSAENDTKKLTDKRNNKSYQVTKLKDGNCWMTDNLNIVNKTITPADSDMLSGSFTIPASSTNGFIESDVADNIKRAYSDNSYGGYYNWYTATAGSGNASFTTGNQNAPYSICPKGWRLPVSMFMTNGQFANLLSGLSIDQMLAMPYNFARAGQIQQSSINGKGTHGWYWSSTAAGLVDSYRMWIYEGAPASTLFDNSRRYIGGSVRCVAR